MTHLAIGTIISLTRNNMNVNSNVGKLRITGVLEKDTAISIYGSSYSKTEYSYTAINLSNNQRYALAGDDSIKISQTKKLYGYKDSNEEIHWNTQDLSPSQRKSLGITRAEEFDKEFDI